MAVRTANDDFHTFMDSLGFTPAQTAELLKTFLGVYNQNGDGTMALEAIQQSPVFAQRFPGIAAMRAAGMNPISPSDYVSFENTVHQISTEAGIPQGFIDAKDISNMLAHGMTAQDVSNRIQNGMEQALSAPPQTLALLDQWHGIKPGSGALAAYYLDPNKALPLLEQQTQAAGMGGQALQAGFSAVDQNALVGAAAAGATMSSSSSSIKNAAAELALTKNAQVGQGGTVSQQQLLTSAIGGPQAGAAETAVEGAKAARGAAFGGGGTFGTATASTTGTATE